MANGRRLFEDLLLLSSTASAADAARGVDQMQSALREQANDLLRQHEEAIETAEELAEEQARIRELLEAEAQRRESDDQLRRGEAKGRDFILLGERALQEGRREEAARFFGVAARSFPAESFEGGTGMFCRVMATCRQAAVLSGLDRHGEVVQLLAPVVDGRQSAAVDEDYSGVIDPKLREILDDALTRWEHAPENDSAEIRRLRARLYLDPHPISWTP